MFIDKRDISDSDYLYLLFLNSFMGFREEISADSFVSDLAQLFPDDDVRQAAQRLVDLGLIDLSDPNGKSASELGPDSYVGLSKHGFAFLINYANEYLERVKTSVPDAVVADLVRYLELAVVPAADRYVRTTDNLPAFQDLTRELEIIRDEVARDLNKDELPIPEKRAVIADLDGFLAQLKEGYVRLSDLTSRIRPLVRNIADWCKDFVVIATAAGVALEAIKRILSSLQ